MSIAVSLPFDHPLPSPLPSDADQIWSVLSIQDSTVLPTEHGAKRHSTGVIMPCLQLGVLKMGIIFLYFYCIFLQRVI